MFLSKTPPIKDPQDITFGYLRCLAPSWPLLLAHLTDFGPWLETPFRPQVTVETLRGRDRDRRRPVQYVLVVNGTRRRLFGQKWGTLGVCCGWSCGLPMPQIYVYKSMLMFYVWSEGLYRVSTFTFNEACN